MEHFISLTIKADDYSKDIARKWYRTAVDELPSGLPCSISQGDKQVVLSKTVAEHDVTLTIPLTRHLVSEEAERVIQAFDGKIDCDYTVSASKITTAVVDKIEVEIGYAPLIELCTAWAKAQHDEWVKSKLDAGWRYGTKVSISDKTHPLLRAWSELPDEYRVVDTSRPEQLLKLMNEYGYVLVQKAELDGLLKDHRPS